MVLVTNVDGDLQTKGEPAKGLAASRFAQPAEENGSNGVPAAEGEPELDNSSAALASVRATNIFSNPLFLGLRLANAGRVMQIAKAQAGISQLAELDDDIAKSNQRILQSITDGVPQASSA